MIFGPLDDAPPASSPPIGGLVAKGEDTAGNPYPDEPLAAITGGIPDGTGEPAGPADDGVGGSGGFPELNSAHRGHFLFVSVGHVAQ